MEYRNLGRSGLRVSVVGIGCNNFGGRADFEASRRVIHKALDLGINLFDTSDSYVLGKSEEVMGQLFGERRKDAIIATKFCSPMDQEGKLKGASRRYIMSAVEASLRRLKTDWIDLYQQHRLDPLTPIDETLRALDDLVRQGKVRYIGNSNFTAWQTVEAVWTSRHHRLEQFICCQDEYSLLARGIEKDMLPAMQAHGLGLLPYFPLASGLLTGKYKRGVQPAADTRLGKMPSMAQSMLTDANWATVESLEKFAADRGHTILELAMSWLAARPQVASIIAGATSAEQVEANAKAVGWALSADDIQAVDAITRRN